MSFARPAICSAPIWSRKTGVNIADFAKGYRYMLAKDCSLDAAADTVGGPLNNVEFENCRQAAKKNINAPTAWKYGDLLGVLTTDGSSAPRAPRCFFALLQELRTHSSASKLANRFFFTVPDSEMKAPQQLDQILEVLIGIGLVRKKSDLYQTVDKAMLEGRRQSASTWLEGECKEAIRRFADLFPTQAGILLNNNYPAAKQQLSTLGKADPAGEYGLPERRSRCSDRGFAQDGHWPDSRHRRAGHQRLSP